MPGESLLKPQVHILLQFSNNFVYTNSDATVMLFQGEFQRQFLNDDTYQFLCVTVICVIIWTKTAGCALNKEFLSYSMGKAQ